MSDKKKGTNDSSASTKATSKAAGFCKRLEEFFKTAKALERDTEGISEYGKLVDEHSALKKELDAMKQEAAALRTQKDDEIHKLTLSKRALMEAFHEKYREFDADLRDAKAREVQMNQVQDELRSSNQKYNALATKYKELQDTLGLQADQLQEAEAWREDLGESQAQVRRLRKLAAEDELIVMDPEEMHVPVVNFWGDYLLILTIDGKGWDVLPQASTPSSWISFDCEETLGYTSKASSCRKLASC